MSSQPNSSNTPRSASARPSGRLKSMMHFLSSGQKLTSPLSDRFAVVRSSLNFFFSSAFASSFRTFFKAPFGIVTDVGMWIQSEISRARSRCRFNDLLPTSSVVYAAGRMAQEATNCFSGMIDIEGVRFMIDSKSGRLPDDTRLTKLPLAFSGRFLSDNIREALRSPDGGVMSPLDLTRFITFPACLSASLLSCECSTTSIWKLSPSSFALHVLPLSALIRLISSESKHAIRPWCSFLARTATWLNTSTVEPMMT
mmetsp:Transcript_17396/g.44370  ORF Transcript_17396/g.44370 Transcript_17396/m.44370 type:complete len:255 (+) Transcript_17396:1809-2573(+)